MWAIEKIPYNHGIPPEVSHAYDAKKVSHEVYNTNQSGTRDLLGPGITFSVPTVMNGRVYVGTGGELDVLGLLP